MKTNKGLNFIIIVIALTAFFVPIIIVPIIGSTVYGHIKPLFWILIAITATILLSKKTYPYNFNKKDIRQYAFIGALIYIIIYYGVGIIIGYTNSPYNHSLIGIILNIWIVIIPAIAKEFARNSVFKTMTNRTKKNILIFTTIAFIIFDLNLMNITDVFSSGGRFLKFACQDLIPSMAINSILSYLIYKDNIKAALLFKLPILITSILTPVFPANNYSLLCVLEAVVPLIIYLRIEALSRRNDSYSLLVQVTVWQKVKRAFLVFFLLVILSFTTGILPYAPVVIATNSMYPLIKRGDIVVMEEVNFEDLKIDDIIEYKKDNFFVIHRIVEIKNTYSFGKVLVTKGDNNRSIDSQFVKKDQVRGKIVSIVPKLGFPTLWFKELLDGKEANVDIEMGEVNGN